MARPSLARQIAIGLIVYGVLLSIALFVHGLLVNERAERMVWQAMLDTEMTAILARRRNEPGFQWQSNGKLDLYDFDAPDTLPPEIAALAPGLHDELVFADNEWVVLVREDAEGVRHALALDIDGFEDIEWRLIRPVIVSSAIFMLLLAFVIHLGARLLVRPLRELAAGIGALAPDRRGQRIAPHPRASSELEVIAKALNGYLERSDNFVERERAFIDTASHELRTPITVIRGAAQVAQVESGLPAGAARQLERIVRTTMDIEELVSMLLVLARDPARVRDASEHFRLDDLIPGIVDDHRPLCEDKALDLATGALVPCTLVAPEAVVRMAVGNLLRNAIENSDRGTIHVSLDTQARVEIRDPGHGMTPEEISQLYARMARGGGRGAGIGLDLIARLCEHLGWRLDITSGPEQGTLVRLDLSASHADPAIVRQVS